MTIFTSKNYKMQNSNAHGTNGNEYTNSDVLNVFYVCGKCGSREKYRSTEKFKSERFNEKYSDLLLTNKSKRKRIEYMFFFKFNINPKKGEYKNIN